MADPGRGFDAVVVGEYERAFHGSQYALMAPLFEHYGVQLWMPEAGGRVNFAAEGDEQLMLSLGVQSKREVTRTRIRVRTAMAAQAREQERLAVLVVLGPDLIREVTDCLHSSDPSLKRTTCRSTPPVFQHPGPSGHGQRTANLSRFPSPVLTRNDCAQGPALRGQATAPPNPTTGQASAEQPFLRAVTAPGRSRPPAPNGGSCSSRGRGQ
jgi:hypothetical protein